MDANNADIVRVLLQAGANPKTQDLKAGTALSHAKDRKLAIVQGLIEQALIAKGGATVQPARAASASGGPGGARKRDPFAKGALGSQVSDIYGGSAGGRASKLEGATREATKDIKYALTSGLDEVKGLSGGAKKK